jgi:hypothetical protein
MSAPTWLSAVQTGAQGMVSDMQLGDLFDGVWDMSEAENWTGLDQVISSDLSCMPPVVIGALLRYAYAFRERLSSWPSTMNAASQELEHRGLQEQCILQGLA